MIHIVVIGLVQNLCCSFQLIRAEKVDVQILHVIVVGNQGSVVVFSRVVQ